ncbi:hypothetical protein I3843_14G082600 [Carya illinoinensis]|nr:hypothetical protein I3843_14G082600 [Carya illinoinensis]
MGWWRSYAGDEKFSSSTLTILISIFVVLWLAVKKQRKAAVPPLPPGPHGLPIVGYLPFVGTELHKKFHQLCGIYGPIYKMQFSNRDTNIVGHTVTYGGVDIALSLNSPDWKMLRKIFVREMLSLANLDSTFPLRREEVRNTIRNVYNKKGTHIDLGDMAFVTVMNAIMNMLWGGMLRGVGGAKFGAELKHIFAELVMILGKPNVSDLFLALARFDLQGIRRKAKRISETIDGSLAKAKEEGTTKTGQKDFLQVLLELREQDNGAPSMSMTQVKALVFTLRLHPPGPFLLLHTLSESSITGGYCVPKGSSIFLHAWAIQRDPKYWDNPLEFKPKRFLNNAYGRFDYSGNNFKYLPFRSRRRICAGLALGDRTLKYILASFLHSYEWKLPQGSEIEFSDTFGVITKKKNPTIAIPTPRLSKSELYTA